MPYEVKKVTQKGKTGYKVCKKDEPKKCFSKEPLPEERAKKQKIAIILSELGKSRKKKNGGSKDGTSDTIEYPRDNSEVITYVIEHNILRNRFLYPGIVMNINKTVQEFVNDYQIPYNKNAGYTLIQMLLGINRAILKKKSYDDLNNIEKDLIYAILMVKQNNPGKQYPQIPSISTFNKMS